MIFKEVSILSWIQSCLLYSREFANTIPKSFTARYCPYTSRIEQLDNKKLILKNMRQVITFYIMKKSNCVYDNIYILTNVEIQYIGIITFRFRSVAKWLSLQKPWKRLHNYQHSLEIEDNTFLTLVEKMHISSFFTWCIVYIR